MSSFGRYSLFGLSVLVAAGTTGLGVWQLRRLSHRQAANAAALRQRDLPSLDLNHESPGPDLAYRAVEARGRFEYEHELVLRGRALTGAPGIQVVTPFVLEGSDTVVLVNRGFVPSPDAGPIAGGVRFGEAGPSRRRIHGVALPVPDEGDGVPLLSQRGESWGRLDLTALRTRLPFPLARHYVVLGVDSSGLPAHTAAGRVLPIRIEPPVLGDGPHLGYAIQWFMIAAAALGFGIAFVLRRNRPSMAPDIGHRSGAAPPP